MEFKGKKFVDVCPRKMSTLPNCDCPHAMNRIEYIKENKRELPVLPGCPWACDSAQSFYCFWVLADKDDFDEMSIKEIASTLGISPAQVDKAIKTGLEKLKNDENLKDSIQEMYELIADRDLLCDDSDIYLTYNFSSYDLCIPLEDDVDFDEEVII